MHLIAHVSQRCGLHAMELPTAAHAMPNAPMLNAWIERNISLLACAMVGLLPGSRVITPLKVVSPLHKTVVAASHTTGSDACPSATVLFCSFSSDRSRHPPRLCCKALRFGFRAQHFFLLSVGH